jgi:hypothetical protein
VSRSQVDGLNASRPILLILIAQSQITPITKP